MARWRLRDAHYLNVPGIEWEYKEQDRETGRSARKVYNVPLYLNPQWVQDWNDPDGIVVTNKYDPAHRRDHLFIGSPTPDMEPIDDEAQKISQEFIDAGVWKHPIDSLNMTYSESRLSDFEREIAQIMAGQMLKHDKPLPNVSLQGIDPKKFDELQAQVIELMHQNARLQNQLDERPGVKRRM